MSESLQSVDGSLRVYFHSSARMVELANESVDLIVTSPPYMIGLQYGNAPEQMEIAGTCWDDYARYLKNLATVWAECYRVMKPGAYACLNVCPVHTDSKLWGEIGEISELPIPEDTVAQWRAMGAIYKFKYIWKAPRGRWASDGSAISYLGSVGQPLEGVVARDIEEVLIFRKPKGPDYRLSEDRVNRRRMSRITTKGPGMETQSGGRWGDIFTQCWTFPGAPKETADGVVHPAPFPIELPRRCVEGYTVVGDLVCDPFLGTGTTLAACRELGRMGVGYEVEERFSPHIRAKLKIDEPLLTATF